MPTGPQQSRAAEEGGRQGGEQGVGARLQVGAGCGGDRHGDKGAHSGKQAAMRGDKGQRSGPSTLAVAFPATAAEVQDDLSLI